MTDCPNGEMRDLLPDLLHDRLEPAERAAVEAHVAACADCRAELALLAGLRGTIRRAAPSVDVGAIVAALPARRAPVRRSWAGLRAAAVIAAVAVGGTSIAIARQQQAAGPTPVVALAPAVISSPANVAPSPVVPTVGETAAAPSQRVATATVRPKASHELAVSGAMSDLSDGELASLLGGIDSLGVLPAADVQSTPVVPTSSIPSTGGAL